MTPAYTVKDVAKKICMKPATVREMIRRGDLGAYRIGRTYRVSKQHLDRFLESRITMKSDKKQHDKGNDNCERH